MIDEYAAIVYDLDGTLVHLAVDWEAARRDAAAVLRDHGFDTAEMGLWEVLENADPGPVLDAVNAAIAEHERAGGRESTRLPTAESLPHEVPVGVCSLNCEDACTIALATHDIDGYVDAIVGRDTIDTYKPDPQPLLETIDRLGVAPGETLFVGDSERDEQTATRAGVAYEWVDTFSV